MQRISPTVPHFGQFAPRISTVDRRAGASFADQRCKWTTSSEDADFSSEQPLCQPIPPIVTSQYPADRLPDARLGIFGVGHFFGEAVADPHARHLLDQVAMHTLGHR